MSDYFVIENSEDGGYIHKYSKKELELALQDGEVCGDFAPDIPNSDIAWWGDHVLIIKGSIIVPKAKEQVTVWEV